VPEVGSQALAGGELGLGDEGLAILVLAAAPPDALPFLPISFSGEPLRTRQVLRTWRGAAPRRRRRRSGSDRFSGRAPAIRADTPGQRRSPAGSRQLGHNRHQARRRRTARRRRELHPEAPHRRPSRPVARESRAHPSRRPHDHARWAPLSTSTIPRAAVRRTAPMGTRGCAQSPPATPGSDRTKGRRADPPPGRRHAPPLCDRARKHGPPASG